MRIFLSDYLQALRLFSHDVRMYLLTAAVFGFTNFGFVTVLLNLYLLRLGYGTAFIGLVNSATALAFALTSLPSGAIGSRWGYRRIVVAGVSLVGVGTILLPLTNYLPGAGRDAGIVATRLLTGLGFSFYFVNANPYLVAATRPRERTYVFSMQVGLMPLAGFAGSLIAGVLPGFFAAWMGVSEDHPGPFGISIIVAGLLILPAIFALLSTQKVTVSQSAPSSAANPKATALPILLVFFLAVAAMLRMTGEGAARSFFNVYLDVGLGETTTRIGLLAAFGQLAAGPAAMAAPILAERLGKISAIVISTLATAASLLLMGLFPHWTVVGLGFAGVIGMRAITQSVASVVQMEIVPERWRGTTSGIISMAMGSGFTSMALGGGFLIPIIGFQWLYFIAAALVTASSLLFWFYFRVPRGEYTEEDYAHPVLIG
jgi:MFS family permease